MIIFHTKQNVWSVCWMEKNKTQTRSDAIRENTLQLKHRAGLSSFYSYFHPFWLHLLSWREGKNEKKRSSATRPSQILQARNQSPTLFFLVDWLPPTAALFSGEPQRKQQSSCWDVLHGITTTKVIMTWPPLPSPITTVTYTHCRIKWPSDSVTSQVLLSLRASKPSPGGVGGGRMAAGTGCIYDEISPVEYKKEAGSKIYVGAINICLSCLQSSWRNT